jgi:hypothetical protein
MTLQRLGGDSEVAALITWVITALGGFVLRTWISRGGSASTTRAGAGSPGLLFAHLVLAATGLVLWIVYLVVDSTALAWIPFAILVVVALLGFTMAARWLQDRRAPGGRRRAGVGPPARAALPGPIGLLHGLLAPPPSSWFCSRRSAPGPPEPPRRPRLR